MLFRRISRKVIRLNIKADRYDPESTKTFIKRTGRNAVWLAVGQGLAHAFSLIALLMVGRYLGPEKFGVFSYALAVSSIIAPISQLGLNSIVTRDLVRSPQQHSEIIGTSLGLRCFGSSLALIIGVVVVFILRPGDVLMQSYVACFLIGEGLKAGYIFAFWFESQVNGRAVALGTLAAASMSSLIKIVLIFIGAPLTVFVLAYAADGLVLAISFGLLYQRATREIRRISYSFERAKSLLRQCVPLIVSGFTAVVYLKIDQVMLGQMASDDAVGVYAIAARISEGWFFVPIAIATSAFPILLSMQGINKELYELRLQQLFDVLAWLGIGVSLAVTFLAPYFIPLVLGAQYEAAVPILVLHIWGGVFIAMRALVSKWLLAEQMLWLSLLSQGAGALFNILLNFFLIPAHGAVGAALATVISYSIASYFIFFVPKGSRGLAAKMSLAFFAPARLLVGRLPK